MSNLNLIPIFMIGLLGGLHCIGMCGGIVSALSTVATPTRAFPLAVVSINATQITEFDSLPRIVAYNTGRIGSYALGGAIMGGLAEWIRSVSGLAWLQSAGFLLANLMLILLGLYLMNAWRGLARLEAAGQIIWRRIRVLMKRFLPMDNVGRAFALGGLWGWMPCGMVYTVLMTAMFSGSAVSGASVMLAFGLGTLPAMVSLSVVGSSLRVWAKRRIVRVVCGVIVLAFGAIGLINTASSDVSVSLKGKAWPTFVLAATHNFK